MRHVLLISLSFWLLLPSVRDADAHDTIMPLSDGNGEIGWYYAESKRLETKRHGDKLTFHLGDRDNQLYEVNPTTGTRRSLGKPDWAETKAIAAVGDRLYILANGLLQRVNPNDGSREVLYNENDCMNVPSKPRQ